MNFPPPPQQLDIPQVKEFLKKKGEKVGISSTEIWELLLKHVCLFGISENEMALFNSIEAAIIDWKGSEACKTLKESTSRAELLTIATNRLNKNDLVSALRARGKPITGNKMELVSRVDLFFQGEPVLESEKPSFSERFLTFLEVKHGRFDPVEYMKGSSELELVVSDDQGNLQYRQYSRDFVLETYNNEDRFVFVASGDSSLHKKEIVTQIFLA